MAPVVPVGKTGSSLALINRRGPGKALTSSTVGEPSRRDGPPLTDTPPTRGPELGAPPRPWPPSTTPRAPLPSNNTGVTASAEIGESR